MWCLKIQAILLIGFVLCYPSATMASFRKVSQQSLDKHKESIHEPNQAEQTDRLVSVYNYIKQLVQGVTGNESDGDIYKKIKHHVDKTYDVREPGELEEEALEERLCETKSQWVLLNKTVNANGDEVQIVHDVYRQWYHYTECVNGGSHCNAISENYESSCIQTEAFQLMYARSMKNANSNPSFMYVLVPRDCICKAVLQETL